MVTPIAYQAPNFPRPPETWVLALNRYQRDNLLWLLNAVGYPVGGQAVEPFTLANTGDWVGEVAQMLTKVEDGERASMVIDAHDRPNASAAELRAMVARWQAGAGGPAGGQRQGEVHEFLPAEEHEFCAWCAAPDDAPCHERQGRHVCREGVLIEALLAVLRASDDPEQPGETQRLADVSQIVVTALQDFGYETHAEDVLP